MKMKKLSEDHYIIVNDKFDPIDSDRKYVHKSGRIWQWDFRMAYVSNNPPQPITHSTQPEFLGMGWMQSILPLLLSEVKELLGVVDVEKKANDCIAKVKHNGSFIRGYNQALEDNKERKYTEEDLRKMFEMGIGLSSFSDTDENKFKYALNHIQPKTEWEVEFVDGKLKLKS